MANLNSAINVNVDSNLKQQANEILNDLGLNMSVAINMFLKQVVKRRGIPFEIVQYNFNHELINALKEAEKIKNGEINTKGYHNIDELIKDLLD